LEAERARINKEIEQITAEANLTSVDNVNGARQPRKRTYRLTAAGRKKISDMMKARWAARRESAVKK